MDSSLNNLLETGIVEIVTGLLAISGNQHSWSPRNPGLTPLASSLDLNPFSGRHRYGPVGGRDVATTNQAGDKEGVTSDAGVHLDPDGEFVRCVGEDLGGRHSLLDAGVVAVLATRGHGGCPGDVGGLLALVELIRSNGVGSGRLVVLPGAQRVLVLEIPINEELRRAFGDR